MRQPIDITKKPVTVKAMKFDSNQAGSDIVTWLNRYDVCAQYVCIDEPLCSSSIGDKSLSWENHKIVIPTLKGDITASPNDWVIQGVKGEFYPCKPDILDATYDHGEW